MQGRMPVFYIPEESILNTCDSQNNKPSKIKAVTLIDPSLNEKKIRLGKRKMEKKHGPSSESYVLVTILGEIVEENQLMNGDLVQLWAFWSCRCLNVKTLLCFSCCQKIMIKKTKLIKNNYCGSNDLISSICSEAGDFDDRPPPGGIRYCVFHCSEMMLRFNDYFLSFLRNINKGCFPMHAFGS